MNSNRTSGLRRLVVTTAALALAACSMPALTPTAPAPTPTPTSKAPVPAAGAEGSTSLAITMDGYKRDVARTIYRRNPDTLFDGPPPPVLQSIVVLSIRIDAHGNPVRVTVLRSNGYRNHEQAAIRSIQRAAPLPEPNRLVAHNGSAEFVETWLFRDDGRFQIRSLAEAQASVD